MQRIMAAGIVLVTVGALLAMGFWPAVSTSGAELLASQSGGPYTGYATGDRILIRERVVGVEFADFFGNPLTQIEIEDGDPDQATFVYVRGDARPQAAVGSYVYMSAVLQSTFGLPFWEVATPEDVDSSWPVDAAFYGLAGLGVLMAVVGAIRHAPAVPQKQEP